MYVVDPILQENQQPLLFIQIIELMSGLGLDLFIHLHQQQLGTEFSCFIWGRPPKLETRQVEDQHNFGP